MRLKAAIASLLVGCAAPAAWGYQPAVNFQLNCMGCHLADGSGERGRVPSLRRSMILLSSTREGRDFIIRVPGVAQSPLSNEETAALLNWMAKNLSDIAVPPGFADYSAVEVQRSRSHPLARVRETRIRLLQAAHPDRTP